MIRWISYKEKYTKEGITATEIFSCSFDEAWHSDYLPKIGWELPWNADLTVTDIDVTPKGTFFNEEYERGYPESLEVNYTVNYSTMGTPDRKGRANQAASWEIYTTSTMQSTDVEEYEDLVDDERYIWKTKYEATFADPDDIPTKIPPLEMNYIATQLNVICYADFAKYKMMNDALASANNSSFIKWLVDKWKKGLANLDYNTFIPDVDTDQFDDSAGHWLCSAADISQESTNVYKYIFAFTYAKSNWNAPYGGHVTTNQYPWKDFKDFFEGMDETEPESYCQFTRS